MPSTSDKTQFARLQFDPGSFPVKIGPVPKLPDEVKQRFPSLIKWEQDLEAWRLAANLALGGAGG